MSHRSKLAIVLGIAVLCAPFVAAQDGNEAKISTSPGRVGPPATKVLLAAPFDVTAIHSDLAGHPTAAVPGFPAAQFSSFDRPYGSPNGNWILTADTDLVTSADEVLLVNDVVQLFEGDPAAWAPGELVGLLETKVAINDAGDWTFATNTDGATTADEYIVQSIGGVLSAAAQEGAAIPVLTPPLNGAGPFTWGSTLESPVIATDGTVGFSSDAIGGAITTEDDILVLGAALLGQEGVTQPTGQLGTEFWENFDLSDYFIDASGAHWIAQGDLTGDTTSDDVAVVDGAVVLQENVIIPGSGFAEPIDANGIVGVFMDPAGNWYARGNNDVSEQDWVVRNGTVIAKTGDPIYAGATELWSDADFADTFFLHVGNSVGDYVIGGVTDAAIDANGVLVANGTVVVAREGEPIDLDGNGLFDDNANFSTFGNDDAVLTDDRTLYVVATMRDDAGAALGDVFVSIDLSVLGGGPAIVLSKTVGTDPLVCATTGSITVSTGTTVYYCYEVNNIGDVPLEMHDLVDDQLGPIFTGLPYTLAPGATVNTVDAGLTISAVMTATTSNTATWTAYNPGPSDVATATATASVNVIGPDCPAGTFPVTLEIADFEGVFPPTGWTVTNTTTGCGSVPEWTNTDPGGRGNLTGGVGAFAIADSDNCGSGNIMNTEMWTPVMDFTGLVNPRVSYFTDYNDISATSDVGDLDFSIDGGATWTNLISWNEDHRGPLLVQQDFPADNQSNVVVRWNYTNATYDWWWEVDDVTVTACAPAQASISLSKTVGTDPLVCATTDAITVAPGTTVYYCYEVTNTGDVEFGLHDLVDDQLGTILSGFPYVLAPGTSVNTVDAGLTVSAVINATITNTATWTAFENAPSDQASAAATDSATVTVVVPPDIGVAPSSLFASQMTNTTTQQQLTISNTGGSDLTWDIFEEPAESVPAPPGAQQPVTRFDSQAALEAERTGLEQVEPNATEPRDPAAASLARRMLLGGVGLLLVPDSTNDRVMAFDPATGNLVDADFIPADPTNLSTPKSAILSASGTSILVSDQIEDVVQEYGLDGTYIGVYAPAGGVNNAILDNILGIDQRPNGNLLVPVDSGANQDSVAEFDTAGNYLGNFIANGSGGLDGGFDVYPRTSDWLVSSINSDNVLGYDLSGAFQSVLAGINNFPQQVTEASNGNVLVGNFGGTQEGVVELTAAGALVGIYDPPTLGGYRGVYELPNGNILTTNGSGVHEIDRNGNLVETKIAGVSAQFIELAAPQTSCANLADVPWLSANPISGTTAPAGSTPIDVTFDSTGISVGTYDATLCIFSDDPDEPIIPIPVQMEVVIPVELMGFTIE